MTYNVVPTIGDVTTSLAPWKVVARVAATSDLSLTGAATTDGIVINTGDLVLAVNQSVGSQRGLYIADTGGPWKRHPSMDDPVGIHCGDAVYVAEGTQNAGVLAVVKTPNPIVVGVTNFHFEVLSSVANSSRYNSVYVGNSSHFDFQTLADAVDSGARDIIVAEQTTESRDTQFVYDTSVKIVGAGNVGLGDFRYRIVNNSTTVNFESYGPTTWSPITPKAFFDCSLVPFTADTTLGSDVVTNMVGLTTADLRVGQSLNGGASVPGGVTLAEILSSTSFRMGSMSPGPSTVGENFDNMPLGGASVYLNGVSQITGHGATAPDCHMGNGIQSFIVNGPVVIDLPDQPGWGFHDGDAQVFNFNSPVALIANTPGTNRYNYFSANANVPEIILAGNFHATNPIISMPAGSTVGEFRDIFTTSPLNIEIGGDLNKFSTIFAPVVLNIKLTADNARVANFDSNAGNVNIDGKLHCKLENVRNTTFTNAVTAQPGATLFSNYLSAGSTVAVDYGALSSPYSGVKNIVFTDSPYVPAFEGTIEADATAGAITINLPVVANYVGRMFTVKKTDNVNPVTIVGSIDGGAGITLLQQFAFATFVNVGTYWALVALSAGSGATVDDTLALGDFPVGGSLGPASSTCDLYSSLSVNQSSPSQSVSIANPSSTTPGRRIAISNVGTTSFTITNSGIVVPIGQFALYEWSGIGWFPVVGSVSSGWTNSGGALYTTNLSTFCGVGTNSPICGFHIGKAFHVESINIADQGVDGDIGTNTSTVDVCASFRLNQVTSGRTLSLPVPFNNMTGRFAECINTGAVALVMHGITLSPGDSRTFFYDNTLGWVPQSIAASTTATSTFLGQGAGALSSGNYNTGSGAACLSSLISGQYNSAYGHNSLHNYNAEHASAFGRDSMFNVVGGDNCSAFGMNALRCAAAATPSNVSAFGVGAAAAMTTGSDVVAHGVGAVGNNTIGQRLVGIGNNALGSITTTNDSTAVGHNCLQSSTGTNDTAMGSGAMQFAASAENNNCAFGKDAGKNVVSPTTCVIIGALAMDGSTGTVAGTTVVGALGLRNVQGDDNTGIGESVGNTVTTGSYNTLLGAFCDVDAGARTGSIAIGIDSGGNQAVATVDNGFFTHKSMATVPALTPMVGYVSATGQMGPIVSSRRFKEHERECELDTSLVYKLTPVTYERKREKCTEHGYIAEDVVQFLPSLVPLDKEGLPFSVCYDRITILLVEELRKLRDRIAVLESR